MAYIYHYTFYSTFIFFINILFIVFIFILCESTKIELKTISFFLPNKLSYEWVACVPRYLFHLSLESWIGAGSGKQLVTNCSKGRRDQSHIAYLS